MQLGLHLRNTPIFLLKVKCCPFGGTGGGRKLNQNRGPTALRNGWNLSPKPRCVTFAPTGAVRTSDVPIRVRRARVRAQPEEDASARRCCIWDSTQREGVLGWRYCLCIGTAGKLRWCGGLALSTQAPPAWPEREGHSQRTKGVLWRRGRSVRNGGSNSEDGSP